MKKFLLLSLLLLGSLSSAVAQDSLRVISRSVSNDTMRYSRHTLIIYYAGNRGKTRLLKAVSKYGAKVIYLYRNFSGMAISLPPNKPLEAAIRYFRAVKGVLSVNKDYIYHLDQQH